MGIEGDEMTRILAWQRARTELQLMMLTYNSGSDITDEYLAMRDLVNTFTRQVKEQMK